MKQLDLADVANMCPFHDFILNWLRDFGFKSLMLYREEGKPEREFQVEMALCLQEILEEYGPLLPEDIAGQVDRAIVMVDCNDRIVACLTYDCQEFTGSPPVLSMVVKHFAIAQFNQAVCEQIRELLLHSFDLLLRSCVEDDREEDLQADMHRVGNKLHMVFICDVDDEDLLHLLGVQGFVASEIEWGQLPPIDRALIKEVDLGMARASREHFSDATDEFDSSEADGEMELDTAVPAA
jgi:hypothetical protein